MNETRARSGASAAATPSASAADASDPLARLDLNLLRLFDAVYRSGSVSRAADQLKISQPAASNGIARLRALLGDALFARVHGGVRPTPVADHLAVAVKAALDLLAGAMSRTRSFEPARSPRLVRLHMSDIGEARFLPALMTALHAQAPGVRVECRALPHSRIAGLLDSGELDFAFGFLPSVLSTERVALVQDRYVVMVRDGHPVLQRAAVPARPAGRAATAARPTRRGVALADLRKLDFVAVRSHSQTVHILELLGLQDRVRLSASHFLALPAIVRSTDLAVVMPGHIARDFAAAGGHAVIESRLPLQDFTVSLHWSRRRESDPALTWLRGLIQKLFAPAPARA